MTLYDKLYEASISRAQETEIELIHIGISYTAVKTVDGEAGIAYTFMGDHKSCTVIKDPVDYEGKRASLLLQKIFSDELIERSVALALINALNYERAGNFRDDKGTLLDDLGIRAGSRVSMVGYFGPVLKDLKEIGAITDVLDNNRNLGTTEEFYHNLQSSRDALILTSTSIINRTVEEILMNLPENIPSVLLGPSTPMLPEVFRDLPVTVLAGTVPEDINGVLKAIRHGKGTPVISRSCRKVYAKIR